MPTIIVIGGQWGDEGKGKVVDYLSAAYQPEVGVRFNGGPNAGHSIENEFGKFVLHQVPATIFDPNALSIMGNGVVIDLWELTEEIKTLERSGVDCSGLRISDRAHLIMPWHKVRDRVEERTRAGHKIGTTGRGIGPAYSDKFAREGLRVVDLLASDWRDRVVQRFRRQSELIGRELLRESVSLGSFLASIEQVFSPLRTKVVQTEALLANYVQANILLEGAQGTLLDPEFGSYPMVTSSLPTRLGAYQGSGVAPRSTDVVLGVFKGYATRVGEGPFPTELCNQQGEDLRQAGIEFGATTGRPRRTGWFDAVLARYACQINGFTGLVLTKSDVLDTMETVKICTGYKLDGSLIDYPPTDITELEKCEPVYEEIEGWQTPTNEIRKLVDLPFDMKRYIERIEELVGVSVDLISIGPKREETIEVRPLN